ncbi:MAG: WD40 repeat domain-containing protein [Chloroflexi bacterium]|nr:WD40 repeat domain-containing protein [Chloroflexota bacterium]
MLDETRKFIVIIILLFITGCSTDHKPGKAAYPPPPSTTIKETGTDVLRQGHIRMFTCSAWSPDGSRIACGGADRRIRIWDVKSRRLMYTLKGMNDDPWGLIWTPDGYIIAACLDGTIHFWKYPSGVNDLTFQAHDDSILSIALKPGGNEITTASQDGTIKLWEPGNKKPLLVLAHKGEEALSVALTKDYIAGGFNDGKIIIRTLTGKNETRHIDTGSPVVFLAAEQAGNYFASVDEKGKITIWEIKNGNKIAELTGPAPPPGGLAFSSSGKYLAAVSQTDGVIIWRKNDAGEFIKDVSNTTAPGDKKFLGLYSVSFSPSGDELAVVGRRRAIRILSLKDNKWREIPAFQSEIYAVDFLNDQKHVISSGGNRRIDICDIKDMKPVSSCIYDRADAVGALLVLPDKNGPDGKVASFVSGDISGNVCLWEGAPQKGFSPVKEVNIGETEIWKLRLSPDKKSVIAACEDGYIRILDLPGLENSREIKAHSDSVVNVVFHPGGDRLSSSSCDNTIHIYSWPEMHLLRVLKGHTYDVYGLAFSGDGKKLYSVSGDRTLREWDIEAGKLIKTYHALGDCGMSIIESPAELQLYSIISWDGIQRFWNPSAPEKWRKTLIGRDLLCQAYSDDGSVLVVGDAGGKLNLMDGRTGELKGEISLP